MKLFASIVSLFIIGAATAQNPTILQGNYITNVFGNSNFVLNPNAQTNTANVAVSNATVTRSTTTPLVATSEFNITTSTATGYADWSLRAFDQGMKNNNCEARFTYRGFSVGTTTAQILQGANVVAQLALTPSTDPRIASINFPCGDLSAVTKFRLQQATASLTGTNEISGIYTGLATNMANVAQAENVVQAWRGGNQTIGSGGSPTTVVFNSEGLDAYGEMDTSTGIFTAKRAGNYLVNFQLGTEFVAWDVGEYMEATLFKNSTEIERNYQLLDATQSKRLWIQGQQTVALAVGDTLKVTVFHNRGANTDLIGQRDFTSFNISRFPSSSELVVTPERQNVWASAEWNNADLFQYFQVADPTGFLPYTRSGSFTAVYNGSAQAPLSATQVGFSVANLPVGKYEVRMNQGLRAAPGTAAGGDFVICQFRMRETTTNIPVGLAQQIGQTDSNFYVTDSLDRNLIGIFNNTSVGTRNFIFESNKVLDFNATNNGQCGFSTSAFVVQRPVVFTLIPLDQPSNSALYVQGPVKAAATGATIAAGYVFEQTSSSPGLTITNNVAAVQNITSFTLNPGVWMVEANCIFRSNSTTATSGWNFAAAMIADANNSTAGTDDMSYSYAFLGHINVASQYHPIFIKRYINVTTATTYYLNTQNVYGTNNPTVGCNLKRTRLN